MRKILLLIICAAMIAAPGCSGGKKAKKNAAGGGTAPKKIEPSVKERPEQLIDNTISDGEAAQKETGTINGSVIITDIDEGMKGNLYIFIVDDAAMPKDIVVLAATFISENDIKIGRTPFTLKNVPIGTWSLLAVWDTEAPHCSVRANYCEASSRDGIGMSANLVTLKPGEVVENADVAVFF